jgi:hypothetical protein
MNYGKLGNWLQISANIGIVFGLVLVGVQLKQNSNLMKTQLLYEESYRATELESRVVGENAAEVWARSLTDAKSLSLADQRIMEALLWSFIEQLRASRMLADLGLLDDEEWRARVESDAAFYLANKYGVAWWTNLELNNSVLPDDLKAAINAALSDVDYDFTLDYARNIMELVNEQGKNDNGSISE